MNILIIARYWGKQHGIASVRPKKIAKFFAKKGHNVVALVEKNTDMESMTEIDGCTVIPCFNCKEKKEKKQNNVSIISSETKQKSTKSLFYLMKQRIKSTLWAFYKTVITTNQSKSNARNAFKRCKNIDLKFDVIFSSYGPIDNHFLAYRFKKKHDDSTWVADFRDPLANIGFQAKRIYRYYLKLQTKISRLADITTIVSETWKNELLATGSKNVFTLYSGFDPDDFIKSNKILTNELVFSYTGSLYSGLSDLSPFVNAFSELFFEGIIKPGTVRINYAGPNSDVFKKQFEKIDPFVELKDYGFVSRKESLDLIYNSDILLHSLFCYPGYNGIITGKIGEYWEAHKPIVCIVTGSERPDEFISIFSESKTGFLFDGTSQSNLEELKDYIKTQYMKKINQEPLLFDRNDQFINSFNYDNIISKLLLLIEEKKVH